MRLDHSLIGQCQFFYTDEEPESGEKINYQVIKLVHLPSRGLRFEASGWGYMPFTSVINDSKQ